MPTKKIVLSNNATLLAIMKNSFFQREGFGMVLVEDDQTCFHIVEAEAPTLVVLDLAQLGEQALACCQKIKDDPLLAVTPVLLLLPEEATEELVDACWNADCDAVVHRPLVAERLLDASCGLLGISRRLARRFPVSFQLELLDSAQKKHLGSCVNLNDGGMFLATETLFPVDTLLTIEFTLPGFQGGLHCSVRVAWVNHPEWRKKNSMPCGIGLQFEDPSQTVKSILQSFLESMQLES
ncbi:MAG: PilZ domain-containing protein [Desulfuromonadales bacterium]|nr:PilZ domain-containing protein [Desulfuromonadales bacterium]